MSKTRNQRMEIKSVNTSRFSYRIKSWIIGNDPSKRRRQFKTQPEASYEALEPRKMLNGDGATDLREDVLESAFSLPPEVGQSLLNIMDNSGNFSAGPWQATLNSNFGSSTDWSEANVVNAPEDNSWRDYIIDDAGETGLITDSNLDYIPLDGGGFLVFQVNAEMQRDFIVPDGTGGGTGGPSSGGMTEDSTLGSLQKESISTENTTSFVWVGSQAEVDAITSTGSFDPEDHGSNFVITINNDFEFDDRELTGNQIRSFKVTNNYLVSVSYAWNGSSSTSKPSGDGTLTDSVDYDTSGVMLFEGEHVYEGTVAPDDNGEFIETFEQLGSGTGNMVFISNNIVTSSYAEGDLINTDTGSIVTATVADDFRYLASSSFTYTGDGGRVGTTNDAQSEYHLQTLGYYELDSSPTITSEYESVMDITVQYNQDILDSLNDDGDDGSADGDNDEEPQLAEQVLVSASGFSTATSIIQAHGNTTTSFDDINLYGGISNTYLDSDSLDHWDTTGSNFSSNNEYEVLVTSPGYYLKRTGNGEITITNDSIGESTSLTVLTSSDVENDDIDPDVEGFIDSDTDIILATTHIETSGGFNDRLVISSTIGDEDNEAVPPTSDAAAAYLNSYVSAGIDPDGAANNPEQPHSQAGTSNYYAITQANYSNTYHQHEEGSEDNLKLNFLTGDASEVILDGQNQPTWTSSSSSQLSFDTQFSSGNFEGGNGQFYKDHYSIINNGESNGTFGGDFALTWALEEGAITEVPIDGESDDGSGDSTGDYGTVLEIDETKVTILGSSNSNSSSMIDSDVTTINENSLAKGYLPEGEFDADGNPVDPDSAYRLEVWESASSFTELANLTGGASTTLADQYTAATQSSESDTESNYASDSDGSGTEYHFYSLDQVDFGGETNDDGSDDGTNDEGEVAGGSYDRHELHYSYVSNAALHSEGEDASEFARNLHSKIVDHSIEDETGDGGNDGGNSGGGAGGGAGGGPGGGTSDGDQDPPPSYDIDLDENRTLSNSGITTADASSSYGLTVSDPSFSMSFDEHYTGRTGMDDGVVETREIINLSSVSGSQTISSTDETQQEHEWREDGLYLITNGFTETVIGASSVATNSGEGDGSENDGVIKDIKVHDYGNGTTKTVTNTIPLEDYRVTYNNTTTLRDDFEDFGQKVTLSVEEATEGDSVQNVGGGLIANGTGEGTHTRTITQTGNEDFILKPTKVETKQTPFGSGTRSDNVDLNKTGNWNLTDEIVGEFDAGGSYKITFTPTGFRNSGTTLITNGDHSYTYDQTDNEGYALNSVQTGEYDSTTTLASSMLRSGSIESNYASDGVLVAATGSILETTTSSGTATANEDAKVDKTKSRTVQLDNDTDGNAGDTDGNGGGPDRTSYDEVYTAGKHLDFTSSDSFFATVVAEYEAGMDAEGDLSIDLVGGEVDIDNEVWGIKSGTLATFLDHEITSHFDDGTTSTEQGDGPVFNDTLTLDDSYGDTVWDGIPDGTKSTDQYVGFFRGDDTDSYFGSAGFIGSVVDTSYDQGAAVGPHIGGGESGLGEVESEFSSLLDESLDGEIEYPEGDNVFGIDPRTVYANHDLHAARVEYYKFVRAANEARSKALAEMSRDHVHQYDAAENGKIPFRFIFSNDASSIRSGDKDLEFEARMHGLARVSGAVFVVTLSGGSALLVVGGSVWAVDQTQAGVRQMISGEQVATGGQAAIESLAGKDTRLAFALTLAYDVGPDGLLAIKSLAKLASSADDLAKIELALEKAGASSDEIAKMLDESAPNRVGDVLAVIANDARDPRVLQAAQGLANARGQTLIAQPSQLLHFNDDAVLTIVAHGNRQGVHVGRFLNADDIADLAITSRADFVELVACNSGCSSWFGLRPSLAQQVANRLDDVTVIGAKGPVTIPSVQAGAPQVVRNGTVLPVGEGWIDTRTWNLLKRLILQPPRR